MTTADRVLRGIALLDERGPECWREVINLDILDMSDPGKCILGQLYPSYLDALASLGIPESAHNEGPYAEDYGFEFVSGLDEYRELTEEWLVQLSVVRD